MTKKFLRISVLRRAGESARKTFAKEVKQVADIP